MDIDPYRVVAFLHVLLFAYWLGADLGVFLHGKRLTRDDIPLAERLRTREIGVMIDMAPRSALVLMVPVGFTLASNWGLPLTALQIGLLWVFGLFWLWLVWEVHHKKNEPVGRTLQRIDFCYPLHRACDHAGFGRVQFGNRRPRGLGLACPKDGSVRWHYYERHLATLDWWTLAGCLRQNPLRRRASHHWRAND